MRGIAVIALTSAIVSLLIAVSPANATPLTFTTLDDPNATAGTFALGISDSGTVVGFYVDGIGVHGFTETGGVYATLDAPGAVLGGGCCGTDAFGINNAGTTVVGAYSVGSGVEYGFTETAGAYATLIYPLATRTDAYGINDAGTIVGSICTTPAPCPSGDASGENGFTETDGVFTILDHPGATSSMLFGVNNNGTVVGTYDVNLNGYGTDGYFETSGVYTTLDDPSATSGTTLFGINDDGTVVGTYDLTYDLSSSGTGLHSFIETGDAFTTLDDPDATDGTIARGINNDGTIVGYYYDASGYHGFVATQLVASVPEPGSLSLFGAALVGLGAVRRRKRKSA